jgi:chorismate mutase
MTNDLLDLRKSIDLIDSAVIAMLAERFRVTQKVGEYKKQHKLPPVDPTREAVQFERIEAKAQEIGLDPKFARKFLRLVIDEVVKNHKGIQGIED